MYPKLILFLIIAPLVSAQAQIAAPGEASPIQLQRPFTDPSPAETSAMVPGSMSATKRAESWTALKLADSGLPLSSTGGILLSKTEQPEFTRELLTVQWRPGDPIDLYVIRPRGVARPPVILYLYNYTSDTDRFRDDGWCRRATQDGFAAVGFVSALSGQRFHLPRPMREWFVSELQEALATSTHDVQMVLNYLDTRGDLDMKSVGMFGQESGGAVAILAAATDSRIQVLDVINPWGDWPEWLEGSRQIPEEERPAYLKPEFLQKVSSLDPVEYLEHLKLKALRVQQIAGNLITPPKASARIAAAVPHSSDLVRYNDVDALQQAWRAKGLSGWLREQLRPQILTSNTLP